MRVVWQASADALPRFAVRVAAAIMWVCQHCTLHFQLTVGQLSVVLATGSPLRFVYGHLCESEACAFCFGWLLLDSPKDCNVRRSRADSLLALLQVPCYGTRTTAATEAWVQECVASGRGAKYGLAQLGVTQGGCIEPR